MRTWGILGKKRARNEAAKIPRPAANKYEPCPVKSYLVCIANALKAKTMPAVNAAAVRMSFASYLIDITPIINP